MTTSSWKTTADGSRVLADTVVKVGRPVKQQEAEGKAIALAFKALEIHTQLHRSESETLAMNFSTLKPCF